MTTKSLVSLASIRNELKSGDIVFFQGLAADSVLIRDLTGGAWSHCALIVRGEDIGNTDHELLLFESSITAGQDIGYSGQVSTEKAGVMLVDFAQRMADYASSKDYSMFGIRHLNSDQLDSANTEELKSFVSNKNIRQSEYPAEHLVAAEHFIAKELESSTFTEQTVTKIKTELQGEAFKTLGDDELKLIIGKTIEAAQENLDHEARDKTGHSHATISHYFCSELVVDALMHMGVLKMGNAAGFSPSDLSDESDSPLDEFYSDVKYISGDLG